MAEFEDRGRVFSKLAIKARVDGKLGYTHLPQGGVNAEVKIAAEYPGQNTRGGKSGHLGWANTDLATVEQRRRTEGTAETKLGTDLNSKEYGNGILNGMTHIHGSLDESKVDRPVSGMRLRVGKK